MNKYLKLALCAYPLFAMAEEKKTGVDIKSLVYGGGVYGSYLFTANDFLSVGPFVGLMYHSSAKMVGTMGALVRMNLDQGYFFSGVRLMAGALLWMPHKDISLENVPDRYKEGAQKFNKDKNSIFRGMYGIIALDFPYVSAGIMLEYAERSRISKGFSAGLVIMPNYSVGENIELGAVAFANYSISGTDEEGTDSHVAYQEIAQDVANLKKEIEDIKAPAKPTEQQKATLAAMESLKEIIAAKAAYTAKTKKTENNVADNKQDDSSK